MKYKELREHLGKTVKVTVLDPAEYSNEDKKITEHVLARLVVIGSLDLVDKDRIVVCPSWYDDTDVSGLSTHALPISTIVDFKVFK